MEEKTKKLIQKVGINMLLGGIMIGLFVFLIEYFTHGLGGYLAGVLPLLTLYMLTYTYIYGTHKQMVGVAWTASISSSIYIMFCIIFALMSTYLCVNRGLNLAISLIVSIGVWIVLNYLLVMKILPKFDIYLLDKTKGIEMGESLIDKVNCEKLK